MTDANRADQTRTNRLRARAPTDPPAVAQSKPNSIVQSSVEPITPEKRARMICEAAYFIAEHRGFEPGHDVEDWLAAETQVDSLLKSAMAAVRSE